MKLKVATAALVCAALAPHAVLAQGSSTVEPVSVTPFGDELVVAHVRDTMEFEGTTLELDAVVVWRIVDGRLAEAWDIPAINTARPRPRSQTPGSLD